MNSTSAKTVDRDSFFKLHVWAFTLLAIAALAFGQPAQALIYTYDNTTSGAIPYASTNSNCATTNLPVTFTVPDSFTVSSIAIGLNISHAERGDVRAILVAPNGTTILAFITQNNDTNDNYDILVLTNTEGALNDGANDPTAEPYYNRLVPNPNMNFYTGNASGTWTLRLCDRDNNGGTPTNGTFNHARLILTSAASATPICTSTIIPYDWGSNGNGNAFTSATVGGVTITQDSTANFGSSTIPGNTFTTQTGTTGNHTGYYRLSLNTNEKDTKTVGNRVIFSFSVPVNDLNFTLLDVDATTDGFEDQTFVYATDSAGNPVPYTATVAVGGVTQMAGNTAEGDGAATATQTIGNVLIQFQGAVATVSIEFTQGDNPATGTTSNPFIGISDFNFCAFDYGDTPNSYGTQLSSGARHVLGSRNLYLGANRPDGEADGAPGAAATIDNTTGVNDEDGVASFPTSSTSAGVYTVSVAYTNNTGASARLCGWIDFDKDGAFNADERACADANTAGAVLHPSRVHGSN